MFVFEEDMDTDEVLRDVNERGVVLEDVDEEVIRELSFGNAQDESANFRDMAEAMSEEGLEGEWL